MNGLVISFQAVFPMFALMTLGYLLKRRFQLLDSTLQQMNKLVFSVFLPTVLFRNIYTSNPENSVNKELLVFAGIATFLSFLILNLIYSISIRDKSDCATLIQGSFRSNNVLFGIMIISSIYGGEALGESSMLAALTVVIYNLLVVILFETKCSRGVSVRKLLLGIVTNPMILGTMLGFAVLLLQIKLPSVVEQLLSDVSGITTPVALIILGGTFTFGGLRKYSKKILAATVCKLVILPGIMVPVAILSGFREQELINIMALFGSPTAVASFAMADQMGGNRELAGQIIVVSSIISIVTIFGWIYLISMLGFL
jgi:predicted permease